MISHDPVFYRKGAWWFWDETWAHSVGPYSSEAVAREELAKYVAWLENGDKEKHVTKNGTKQAIGK